MSDDTPTPTPEEVVTAEPEAAPPSREAIAAALGVDVASLDRFKNLDEMAREVMREKSEWGREKAAAPAAPAADEDEDVGLESIDPKTLKLLNAAFDKRIQEKYGSALALPSVQFEDEAQAAVDAFMSSHADVKPEVLSAVMDELNANGGGPKKPTIRAINEFMATAYKIACAQEFDAEAADKAAEERAYQRLVAEAAEKGEVVRIEKKSGVTDKVDADQVATERSFWERIGIATEA